MTIYFAGGEDSSFSINSGSVGFTPDNTAGRYRYQYARGSISIYAPVNAYIPPAAQKLRVPTANLTNFWLHFWALAFSNIPSPGIQFISLNSDGAYAITQGFQQLVTNTATVSGIVYVTGTVTNTGNPGQLSLSVWQPPTISAAGTVSINIPGYFSSVVTESFVYPVNSLFAIDMNYNVGVVTLYINGIRVLTGSVGSAAQQYVEVSGICNSFNVCFYSEFIVSDTDTRGKAVLTIPPVANGNTNTWTGAVGNVDEFVSNDGSYNYTAAANQLAEYTVTYSLPPGTWTVDVLVEEARVSVGSTGPEHFEWLVRTGSTDYATGSISPTAYFDNYSHIWPQNPNTATAWGTLDFGTGFNIGVESLA